MLEPPRGIFLSFDVFTGFRRTKGQFLCDSSNGPGNFRSKISNFSAPGVKNCPKTSKNRFFEVYQSNAAALLGPPRESILPIFTFLRENINSKQFRDPT